VSAALAEITRARAGIREQVKVGKIPGAIFKSWLAEFAKQRVAMNRPATAKSARISRSEFLQEYKSGVARKLNVSRAVKTSRCRAKRCVRYYYS
jgi:hypothetical protein